MSSRPLQEPSSLLVAIPAFQAASTLPSLLTRIRAVWTGPVLVVDDGSGDATADVARKMGAEVIRHGWNMGKGQALATAFQFALDHGFDGVIHLDADLQHPPELLPRFADALKGADLVVGSRRHALARMPRDRQVSNRLTSLVLSILTGKRIPDSQSGYRALRCDLLARLFPFWTSRYETESEILFKALRLGARVVFLPIPVVASSSSHIQRGADTLRFLRLVGTMLWHL